MIAVCIGRKEQGKSTLGYFLAHKSPVRVVFDPREHYSTSDALEPDASQLFELLDEKEEIIIQAPFHVPQHFASTCDALMDWVRGKRMDEGKEMEFSLLVDEAYDAKTFEAMPDSLDWLMRKTASSQARIVFTAHQPKHLATDIRALANHFFLFQITQEHDLRAIEDRCGREVAEMLPGLGPRQIVHWDDDKQIFERFDQPKAWYIDIHANQQTRKKTENGTALTV